MTSKDQYRILVCGGRDFTDRHFLFKTLKLVIRELFDDDYSKILIISGCARGADTLAIDFAKSHLTNKPILFPADWKKYGKKAGIIRNSEMITKGHPDLVIAFPGDRGTQNMVKQSLKAGIKLLDLRNDGSEVKL